MTKDSNSDHNPNTESMTVAQKDNILWDIIDHINGEKKLPLALAFPNLRIHKSPNLLEAPYYFTNFFDKISHKIPSNTSKILEETLVTLQESNRDLKNILNFDTIKTLYFLSLQDGWYSLLPSIANKLVITKRDEDPTNKTKLLSYEFESESYKDILISTEPWTVEKKLPSWTAKKFITRWTYKYNREFDDLKSILYENEICLPEELSKNPHLVYHKRLSQSIIDVFDLFCEDEKRQKAIKIAAIKETRKNKKKQNATSVAATTKTKKDEYISDSMFNKKLNTIKVNLKEDIYNSIEIYCSRLIFRKSYHTLDKKKFDTLNSSKNNTPNQNVYKSEINKLNKKLKILNKYRDQIVNILDEHDASIDIFEWIDGICLAETYIDKAYYTKKHKNNNTHHEYNEPYHEFFNNNDKLYNELKDELYEDIIALISEKFFKYQSQVDEIYQEKSCLESEKNSTSEQEVTYTQQNLDKLFERPWIFRLYFELIRFFAVKSGKRDFIDIFVKESKKKFNEKNLSNTEKEMLIVKQFYASTLGIFGLTKRDLPRFKPRDKANSFMLNFNGKNSKAFNSYNLLMENLTQISSNLGCAHFDADIDKSKIACLFKLFACMGTLNTTFFNSNTSISNVHITKKDIEVLTEIKLKRLNSNSSNRIDDSFNLSTFFKKLKSTDDIKETQRLSIILGNLIEDITSIGKTMDTTFISPASDLSNFDKQIAKCFCLLDWDKKEILDAIIKTTQQVH